MIHLEQSLCRVKRGTPKQIDLLDEWQWDKAVLITKQSQMDELRWCWRIRSETKISGELASTSNWRGKLLIPLHTWNKWLPHCWKQKCKMTTSMTCSRNQQNFCERYGFELNWSTNFAMIWKLTVTKKKRLIIWRKQHSKLSFSQASNTEDNGCGWNLLSQRKCGGSSYDSERRQIKA